MTWVLYILMKINIFNEFKRNKVVVILILMVRLMYSKLNRPQQVKSTQKKDDHIRETVTGIYENPNNISFLNLVQVNNCDAFNLFFPPHWIFS